VRLENEVTARTIAPCGVGRWQRVPVAAGHPNSKRATTLRTLREQESRAIDLPVIGKFPRPDKHDVVLGGHVLVKQHSSCSLAAVGEVMKDVFGHHI
jgi:hypothetical protein